jgi:hypothetical protein
MIRPSSPRSNDAHVDRRNGLSYVTGENCCSPQRVWHSRNQYIPIVQERATESPCRRRVEKSVRSIKKCSLTEIGKLNEPHVTFRVLILSLNPVTIDEYPVRINQFRNCGFGPSTRERHCTSTSFNSFKIGSRSFPNT